MVRVEAAPGDAPEGNATAAPATPQADAPGGNGGNGAGNAERNRQRQAEREKRRQELAAMTPAQRQEAMRLEQTQREEAMRQQRETFMREALKRAGTEDVATQDTIVEYVRNEMQARNVASQAGRKVLQGMTNRAATDPEVSALMGNLRDAVQDEKARRAVTAKDLDAKVGYTKKPRLEALLTMMGFIGDESSYLNGGNGFGQGNGRGNARGNGNGNGAGANGATAPATGAPNAAPALDGDR